MWPWALLQQLPWPPPWPSLSPFSSRFSSGLRLAVTFHHQLTHLLLPPHPNIKNPGKHALQKMPNIFWGPLHAWSTLRDFRRYCSSAVKYSVHCPRSNQDSFLIFFPFCEAKWGTQSIVCTVELSRAWETALEWYELAAKLAAFSGSVIFIWQTPDWQSTVIQTLVLNHLKNEQSAQMTIKKTTDSLWPMTKSEISSEKNRILENLYPSPWAWQFLTLFW